MPTTRRDFMRQSAAAAAGTVAGIPIAGAQNSNAYADASKLTWSKAPCRFCGTGCGVQVAVKDNRVVATQGDVDAEVNRGLNCVKGYFLSKIMYGDDRLTKPMLRMKNGQYAKDGEFQPVSAGTEPSTRWKSSTRKRSRKKARPQSACSAPASGRCGKAMPPPN